MFRRYMALALVALLIRAATINAVPVALQKSQNSDIARTRGQGFLGSRLGKIIFYSAVGVGILLGVGVFVLGCNNESGSVADFSGIVSAGRVESFTVTSPKSSNLVMVLSWTDAGSLRLEATITDCGVQTGCDMFTRPATEYQANSVRLQVDGSRGKQYRIDVIGDSNEATAFQLHVTYETGPCD